MAGIHINDWKHDHDFSIDGASGEKRTIITTIITALMMIGEIIGGIVFGSMALLADGWHMGTHVAAFGIAVFAYKYASKHKQNSKFSFGTGKVTVLGGFASAMTLLVVAFVMAIESIMRFIEPQEIYFNQAIFIAVMGLAVNIICAVILNTAPHHHHGHHHHDHNLRAAYVHVLADALTSVTAIVGLLTAKYFGWIAMDPLMGIVGSIVIIKWAVDLIRDTIPILLDEENKTICSQIKSKIENLPDNHLADLHVWKVSPNHHAAIISIVTQFPTEPHYYKDLLDDLKELSHVSIEVNKCHENLELIR